MLWFCCWTSWFYCPSCPLFLSLWLLQLFLQLPSKSVPCAEGKPSSRKEAQRRLPCCWHHPSNHFSCSYPEASLTKVMDTPIAILVLRSSVFNVFQVVTLFVVGDSSLNVGDRMNLALCFVCVWNKNHKGYRVSGILPYKALVRVVVNSAAIPQIIIVSK